MREIKFRGKRMDNSEWVYGDMFRHNEQFFIKVIFNEPYEYEQDSFEVIPKTVGQYTGAEDKNDKSVYEGDILLNPLAMDKWRVEFKEGRFVANLIPNSGIVNHGKHAKYPYCTEDISIAYAFEIIGNIYESL